MYANTNIKWIRSILARQTVSATKEKRLCEFYEEEYAVVDDHPCVPH
jgi:hypothetical protein